MQDFLLRLCAACMLRCMHACRLEVWLGLGQAAPFGFDFGTYLRFLFSVLLVGSLLLLVRGDEVDQIK